MKMLGCLLALPLLMPVAQDRTEEVADAAVRSELLRLERVWNDAHMRGDADALDGLWAEELVVTVPRMKAMTKPEVIGVWRTGRMKFLRYETSDIEIRVFGDAAVVTGRLRRQRNMNGRDVQDDWRFTKVYVRRKGRWKVVAWHASESAR